MPRSILIITDKPALGTALTHAARIASSDEDSVHTMIYRETIALLTPERIRETDFFILDLFREYPGGTRAEGITLARRWMPRTPCLIISPLYLSAEIGCPGYWDVSATDTLPERIEHILSRPHLCSRGFDRLTSRFSDYLELPPQHL